VRGGDASAVLSFSSRLIEQAQLADAPVAWVAASESLFFPADMLQGGVDIGSLAIVWPRDALHALRGADALIRSGAFGLVVVDLGAGAEVSLPQQNRLARMAERYGATVVFLHAEFSGHDRAQSSAQNSLRVSLRVEASRTRMGGGDFRCILRALKDNRRAPGWVVEEVRHGTPGLR
jgi:recombination protein RecA